MQLPKIRVYFTDFWPGFNAQGFRIWTVLAKRYEIILDAQDPEILFFSCFGAKHLQFNCVKVFYTGENLVPDFNLCDYAIGFHHLVLEDRYLRFPCFEAEHLAQLGTAVRQQAVAGDLGQRAFCNFIYSNGNADPVRDAFFHLLSGRKLVESLGRHLKNKEDAVSDRFDGDWFASKLETQKAYNFTIAFENSASPGYTTEKIAHAFMAGTIPIYWGDPRITDDFNPAAFIHLRDFATSEDCVNHVIEVSEDPAKMAAYLSAPVFRNGEVPRHLLGARLEAFLFAICDQPADERPRRPRHGGFANIYISRRKRDQRILNSASQGKPSVPHPLTTKGKRIIRRFSFRGVRKLWARYIAR